MDYNKLYRRFIESRPHRKKVAGDGLERHHILPRSLGGKNTKDNIVALTSREHFIAHRLLHKFTTGMDKSKMAYALHRLTCDKRRVINSRTYAHVIELYREENRRRSLKLWQDPKYRAKFITVNSRYSRHSVRLKKYNQPGYKATFTHNRTPEQRVQDLQAKWDSQGIAHNQTYIRSILRQH